MSDLLEGWSYPVSETIPVSELRILDHTFVKAPNKGPVYFDCFGGHRSPKAHALQGASGNGIYAVANCYRLPLPGTPDTAGLGLYATHGVCHQAANRFLWSACSWSSGPTIHNAQAYALSFSFYGTYGRPLAEPFPMQPFIPTSVAPADFTAIYAGCRAKASLLGTEQSPEERPATPPTGFASRVVALHREQHGKEAIDHNAVLDRELKILVEERLGQTFDSEKVRQVRARALNRAHKVATSDLRGRAFADEINDIAVQYQDELEEHLGPENHSTLMQTPPKARYGLVDPEIAERAGTRGTRA